MNGVVGPDSKTYTAIGVHHAHPNTIENGYLGKRDGGAPYAIRELNMAIAFMAPPKGCIHHTDRGSQYCSHDYQKTLRQHGFKVSMSGKGNCFDNAAVETFFKTIKVELIWRRSWETRRQAEMVIF